MLDHSFAQSSMAGGAECGVVEAGAAGTGGGGGAPVGFAAATAPDVGSGAAVGAGALMALATVASARATTTTCKRCGQSKARNARCPDRACRPATAKTAKAAHETVPAAAVPSPATLPPAGVSAGGVAGAPSAVPPSGGGGRGAAAPGTDSPGGSTGLPTGAPQALIFGDSPAPAAEAARTEPTIAKRASKTTNAQQVGARMLPVLPSGADRGEKRRRGEHGSNRPQKAASVAIASSRVQDEVASLERGADKLATRVTVDGADGVHCWGQAVTVVVHHGHVTDGGMGRVSGKVLANARERPGHVLVCEGVAAGASGALGRGGVGKLMIKAGQAMVDEEHAAGGAVTSPPGFVVKLFGRTGDSTAGGERAKKGSRLTVNDVTDKENHGNSDILSRLARQREQGASAGGGVGV